MLIVEKKSDFKKRKITTSDFIVVTVVPCLLLNFTHSLKIHHGDYFFSTDFENVQMFINSLIEPHYEKTNTVVSEQV